jgi:hypothetical protein
MGLTFCAAALALHRMAHHFDRVNGLQIPGPVLRILMKAIRQAGREFRTYPAVSQDEPRLPPMKLTTTEPGEVVAGIS